MQSQCTYCGKPINRKPSQLRQGLPFCSRAHHYAYVRIPVEDRFWSKIICNLRSGCWEWQAHRHPFGYGLCWDPVVGRQNGTHRISWRIHFGQIPAGLWVLHHCDNPPCVRPDHLCVGTQRNNTDDQLLRGRTLKGDRNPMRVHPERVPRGENHWKAKRADHGAMPGESNPYHKLTDELVREMRARYAAGETNLSALGRIFGVDRAMVRRIIGRTAWGHVI